MDKRSSMWDDPAAASLAGNEPFPRHEGGEWLIPRPVPMRSDAGRTKSNAWRHSHVGGQ